MSPLEERTRRLEARVDIDELIARYGLVMDSRDAAALPEVFTADGVVELFLARSACSVRAAT